MGQKYHNFLLGLKSRHPRADTMCPAMGPGSPETERQPRTPRREPPFRVGCFHRHSSVKRHLKSRRVERIEKLNVTWRPRLSLGFRTTGSHSWAHRRLPAGGVISAQARNYNIFDPPHPPRLHAVEQVGPQFKVLAIKTKTSSTQDFSVHTRAAAKATAFLRLRSRSASAMRPYASRLRYPPYAHTVAKT